MDCTYARGVLNDVHGFGANQKNINGRILEITLDHVLVCEDCKSWIRTEICPKVKEKKEKGELSEEVHMGHGMLHDGLLEPDCVALA